MYSADELHYSGGFGLDFLSQNGVRQLTMLAVEKRCHQQWYTVSELSLAAEVEFGRVSEVIDELVDMGIYESDGDDIAPNYRPNENSLLLKDLGDVDHLVFNGVIGEGMVVAD